jgi:DNA-binding MarR family transcriptional regulator
VAELSEKEYLLLQEISHRADASQRELSEAIGLSLGLTNLILNRFIENGLIDVHSVNLKKRRYILSSRGATEKSKFACSNAARSFQQVKRVNAVIRNHILEAYGRGLRQFVIVAPTEVETMIREALHGLELPGASYAYEQDTSKALQSADTVFTAIPVGAGRSDRRVIPILEERSLTH